MTLTPVEGSAAYFETRDKIAATREHQLALARAEIMRLRALIMLGDFSSLRPNSDSFKLVQQIRREQSTGEQDANKCPFCQDETIVELRAVLADIRDVKEPKDDPAPDDADWRYTALEMKRVAEVALKATGKRTEEHKP